MVSINNVASLSANIVKAYICGAYGVSRDVKHMVRRGGLVGRLYPVKVLTNVLEVAASHDSKLGLKVLHGLDEQVDRPQLLHFATHVESDS